MKNGRKSQHAEGFIAPVLRAMRRAARKVREENRHLGLSVLQWQVSKVEEKTA